MYPIDRQPHIQEHFDLFVDGWTLVARRPSPNLPTEKMLHVFRTYMQAGFHDPMFFRAFMILGLVLRGIRLTGNHDSRTKSMIAYHVGQVLPQLRTRLSGGETDNIVLTTVHLLVACNYMLKEYQALGIHATAYHLIVRARGGIDNLGWHGYLKDRSLMVDSMLEQACLEDPNLKASSPGSHQGTNLPPVSLSPDLWTQIRQLPQGFRNLCLSGTLSPPSILFLIGFLNWASSNTTNHSSSWTSQSLEQGQNLLDQLGIGSTERLIVHVIISYSNWTYHNSHEALKEVYKRGVMAYLKQERGARSLKKDGFFVWSCLVLQATSSVTSSAARDAARHMLTYVNIDKALEGRLERMFLPITYEFDMQDPLQPNSE